MMDGGISGLGLKVWGPESAPLPPGGGTPLPPLVDARTVYVDSVGGNNANDGLTPGSAWATLQFAWDDRSKYGELRAQYRCNLLGLGPYTMPIMGASVADVGAGGMFVLAGDTPTVLATGTFIADFVGSAIATSAGLGADTYKNAFVEVTSGALLGAIFQIASNADASITVANKKARTTAAVPIVAGTTFNIWKPTTAVNAPAVTVGNYPGAYNWSGGGANNYTTANNSCAHWLFKLLLTGSVWTTYASSLGFIGCQSSLATVSSFSTLQCGARANTGFLGTGNAANDRLYGCGLVSSGQLLLSASYIVGVFGTTASIGTQSFFGASALVHLGGRIDPGAGSTTIGQQCSYFGSDVVNSWFHFSKGITAADQATVLLQGNGIFAVISGSCLKASRGAVIRDASAITGGTTDAAAFGVDAFNGGRVFIQNRLPVLTGGTAGADVRVNGLTDAAPMIKPNAYFAVNGDAIGAPAFAACVARVSTT